MAFAIEAPGSQPEQPAVQDTLREPFNHSSCSLPVSLVCLIKRPHLHSFSSSYLSIISVGDDDDLVDWLARGGDGAGWLCVVNSQRSCVLVADLPVPEPGGYTTHNRGTWGKPGFGGDPAFRDLPGGTDEPGFLGFG